MRRRFFSFCIVGGTGVIIEIVSFNLFFLFLGFSFSKIFALLIALSVNFTLNRNITFLAREGDKRKQATKYVVVYSIAVFVNYFSSLFANHLLGNGFFNSNISALIGVLIAIPITFFGSLLWVFKKDKIQHNNA